MSRRGPAQPNDLVCNSSLSRRGTWAMLTRPNADATNVRPGGDVTDRGVTDGVRLTDEQRLDWLRLIRSENVGPRTFRALVNHYGGARAALAALPDLARRGGASGGPRVYPLADAEREIKSARALAVSFVALGEPEYPLR